MVKEEYKAWEHIDNLQLYTWAGMLIDPRSERDRDRTELPSLNWLFDPFNRLRLKIIFQVLSYLIQEALVIICDSI